MPRLLSSLAILLVVLPAGMCPLSGHAEFYPDTLIFKDGRRLRGLIVQSTPHSVTLKTHSDSRIISKADMLRMIDGADAGIYFSDPLRKGDLPPWRAIVNDLRTHDKIRRFEEIPSPPIKEGMFRGVSSSTFRINGRIVLTVFGDPNDPVGIEAGIPGWGFQTHKTREWLRDFLAGFLFTKEEFAALYELEDGCKNVGTTSVRVRRKGGWWLSIADTRRVDTMKTQAIRTGARSHFSRSNPADRNRSWRSLRGFERDKNGVFHLIVPEKGGG